jgi:hypothetical protein
VEREIRATRYHGVAVGVMNLPEQTTVGDVLARDDMPSLRGIIQDLTLHELGQALLLLSSEPEIQPPMTTRGKRVAKAAEAPVDKRQLGLPVYMDGRAYRTDAERDRFDHAVRTTIASSNVPMARSDIIAANPCTEHEYRGVISRLLEAGQIEKVGDGRHARYCAAPPPRTTDHDEPTQPQQDGHPDGTAREPGAN